MVRFLRTNMPFGAKPKCHICKSNSSILWRRNEDGSVTCNNCCSRTATITKHKDNTTESQSTSRKTARVKSSTVKQQAKAGGANGASVASKIKNRRLAVRKICSRTPNPILVPSTNSSMCYKGSYLQIGDVVSLVDFEEGVFYALIKGFLEDQYCEKYAMITWLIPTTKSPKDGFDLKTYLLGPEDENPYKLEFLQFVCHCNLDYFFARDIIHPFWPPKPEFDVILTRSGPQMIPHKEKEKSLPYLGPRPFAAEC